MKVYLTLLHDMTMVHVELKIYIDENFYALQEYTI